MTRDEIERLAKYGEICKIYGHNWVLDKMIYLTAPPKRRRICKLCNTQEFSKPHTTNEWGESIYDPR